MRDDFMAVQNGIFGDLFSLMGPHDGVIRAMLPGAAAVEVAGDDGKILQPMHRIEGSDIFEAESCPHDYRLRIDWGGTVQVVEDVYAFGTLLSDYDIHLLKEGRHRDLGRCLGAHVMQIVSVDGVRFAVWAPNARRVSVVGNFNGWDGRRHVMRRRDGGVFEIFIPGIGAGEVYKYEVLDAHGSLVLKADPVAWETEKPPATGSIVSAPIIHDAPALVPHNHDKISIYEVHAPSWMRHAGGKSYSWAELSVRLIPYAKDLGFTHIELLPIMAHPFGGSWGYQPLGQFAPMPELGTPQDFKNFVDACHAAGLGVILDWVPAHFPTDTHGLARFDGTALYEHEDPKEGFHQDWNTLIFNLGRAEVRGFLIASALFWLEYFQVDGLRVDAVASMLYRDYSRKAGEWVPNIYGGRENLEAISFLRELSEAIAERCPAALLIAEESTAWPGVTKPAAEGGLGFSEKWNMGWMHDTLNYLQEEPVNRRYHHDLMTFGLVYAFSEKFVLPISHDEVVHGKRSLLGRMPGDEWQRFANLRAYLGFMWGHPGKKLLFMGCEFGQVTEWNHDAELPWHLLQHETHRGVQGTVRALNGMLRTEPALYERDFDPAGFAWVIGNDAAQSVYAFLRFDESGTRPVLVVCNFTPVPRENYRIGVPAVEWQEKFNSDAVGFGGSGIGNGGVLWAEPDAMHGFAQSLSLTLPPLATIMLVRA
jgi:1,4-alpha-glucan branching enzyme